MKRLLLILISFFTFSAFAAEIQSWDLRKDGTLVAVIDGQTWEVPRHEPIYLSILMAARNQLPVEVTDNGLGVSTATVKELSTMAVCGNVASCPFNNVSIAQYACLLENFEAMVNLANPIYSDPWPEAVEGSSYIYFVIAAYPNEPFKISVNYSGTTLNGTIISKPTLIKYSMMWGIVESTLKGCGWAP